MATEKNKIAEKDSDTIFSSIDEYEEKIENLNQKWQEIVENTSDIIKIILNLSL